MCKFVAVHDIGLLFYIYINDFLSFYVERLAPSKIAYFIIGFKLRNG